jgi:ABC-type oligopeptide transport system substrate-binding subunit
MRTRLLPLTIIFTMLLAMMPLNLALAHDADVVVTTVLRQDGPITWHGATLLEINTLDPQRAADAYSITAIEQLFLGLTNNDPTIPGNITPELATSWTISDDGTVWTFTLRNDVQWIRWDPTADEAIPVRPVTASDVAYGIKRSCDPRLGSLYTSVADKVILGCNDLSHKSVRDVTEADYDLVQVQALDDTTLVVNLQFAASYFLSMTPMWMFRAVPQEVIEEFGDDWTDVGTIVTNGPFAIDEYARGVRRAYARNPLLPADLRGPGNLDRVETTVIPDVNTQFSLYLRGQIELAGVPPAETQSVMSDPQYSDQLIQIPDPTVSYLGFAHDKPPFDNVHARRAFGAVMDRDAFKSEVMQNRGIPMIHFTPPGMFGAPPINEVGMGYDPDYARAELAAAGYPNCEGFPNIEVIDGAMGEFLAASAERDLGCSRDIFTLTSMGFQDMLATIDPRNPSDQRPNMWGVAWGPDYPDAQNWVGDVLSCESENTFKRPCSEVDDLIAQAARESDPAIRVELYYRIEDLFFGREGEHPIIPLATSLALVLRQPWVNAPLATDGLFGGAHYDWYVIDVEIRQSLTGE